MPRPCLFECRSAISPTGRDHFDCRVVIRYAAGVETPRRDDCVRLRPIDLDGPWFYAVNDDPAAILSEFVA